MKLQLSIWAENLKNTGFGLPDPFAVVTLLRKRDDGVVDPQMLGKTEVVPNTLSPDWTRLFVVDYELGAPLQFVVNIYDGESTSQSLGSTVFEVGRVLASPGSIMAKEIKDGGGLVIANLESAQDVGSIRFRLRALELDISQKPDAFYEVQRLRKSTSGSKLWDTVFRSPSMSGTKNPIWGESYLELSALCGSHTDQKFRLAVYNADVLLGDVKLSLDELVQARVENGMDDAVSLDKALPLKRLGAEVGKIVVVEADVTKPEAIETTTIPGSQEDLFIAEDEDDIYVATPDEEIIIDPEDVDKLITPSFANYVSGGCKLHVMVAVDATASNGDPRNPESLHSFEGDNHYVTALQTICNVLSQYDSDQLYPIYGFGAKLNGQINHCFSLSADEKPVAGVDGILSAYRARFRSGLVMSNPRDFADVVQKCTQTALDELDNGHAYSILLIFTSGDPADFLKTIGAFKAANDAPLSIVIVGIGNGDFDMMESLQEQANEERDKLRFVKFSALQADPSALSTAALDHIPSQLETYFTSRHLYPNPEQNSDEIVVEPYNKDTDDIEVPIELNETGDPVVTGTVQTSQSSQDSATQSASTTAGSQQQGGFDMNKIMQEGQKFMKKHQRQIGRVTRKFNNEVRKEIRKKYPKAARFFV